MNAFGLVLLGQSFIYSAVASTSFKMISCCRLRNPPWVALISLGFRTYLGWFFKSLRVAGHQV